MSGILITGGTAGIGYALAERFLEQGHKVIALGRSERELRHGLIFRRCDVSLERERLELFDWIKSEHPDVDTLINNAGIQHRIDLTAADEPWEHYRQEVATNFDAPIHLCMLFAPWLIKKGGGHIINVSSRLGLVPAAWVPIYTSTKAGLHFFTTSLRMQLEGTGVKVTEILPTMVATNLAGKGVQSAGVPVDDFVNHVMAELAAGAEEIGYSDGSKAFSDEFTRGDANELAAMLWNRFKN